jgi:ABC-type nitrate/sulfonate/bicarbonate transport system substrate-binding protein
MCRGARYIPTRNKISQGWHLVALFFACTDWFAANVDTGRRFARAPQRTAAWGNMHRAQSAPMLSDRTKIPTSVTSAMRRVSYAEKLDVAYMQPMLDAAAEAGVLTSAISARDLITKGFIG